MEFCVKLADFEDPMEELENWLRLEVTAMPRGIYLLSNKEGRNIITYVDDLMMVDEEHASKELLATLSRFAIPQQVS